MKKLIAPVVLVLAITGLHVLLGCKLKPSHYTDQSVPLTGCTQLTFLYGDWQNYIVEGCDKKFCCAHKCTGGFNNSCWNECKVCP